MRKFLLVSAVAAMSGLLALAGCKKEAAPPTPSSHPVGMTSSPALTEAIYICPMHPDQVSTEEGAHCPICGMLMVRQGSRVRAASQPSEATPPPGPASREAAVP